MFVLQDTSVEFKALEARLKVLSHQLVAPLVPLGRDVKLRSASTIFPNPEHVDAFFLLKEGVLSYSLNNSVIFHYEADELVGLEHGAMPRAMAAVTTDFAVLVDRYRYSDLVALTQRDSSAQAALLEYISCHAALLAHLNQSFLKKSAEGAPEIRAVPAGEEIILQGSAATEVFTLVDGEAEALVDGRSVGRVTPGELFGVVAALAGTGRTATVRAARNCTVLVINKDNFAQLIESRPATVLKMVEEMARTLVQSDVCLTNVSVSRF